MYPDEQKICYKCATPALITCSRIGYLFTGRWSYDRYLFTGRTTAARPGLVEVTGGNRHRLSRAGNRRINRTLHIMAVVQLRNDTEGRADYRRKLAAGKTPIEAMRALKRRLSDVVYRQMVADAKNVETGPGGHVGAALKSSAADLIPMIDTSVKSLPGPAEPQPRTPLLAAS